VDKRSFKRISVGYKTEIVYGENRYSGTIENLSASGVNVLTDPLDPHIDFLPDNAIDLIFETPSGEPVTLHCTIMWSSKIPPGNVRHRIGMEIAELPWDKVGAFI